MTKGLRHILQMLRKLDDKLLEFRKRELRMKSISILEFEALNLPCSLERFDLKVRNRVTHSSNQLTKVQNVLMPVVTRSRILDGIWLDAPLAKLIKGGGRNFVKKSLLRQHKKTEQAIDQ